MSAAGTQTLDAAASPWVEVYRRLVEVVVPRPIALVSTVDEDGRTNLAPFSFFTVVSANPPLLAFSPQLGGRSGQPKDTLRNVRATRQFVVAVVTEAIAERVNQCSAALPHGVCEFELSGLSKAPAQRVRPPLVAESPVNMECELVEVHSYGSEGGSGNLVVGRLLLLHLDGAVLSPEGAVDPQLLCPVGRMGSDLWVRARDTFPLPRPD